MLIMRMAQNRRFELLILEAGDEAGVFFLVVDFLGAEIFFLVGDFFFFGRVLLRALEGSDFFFF